MNKSQHNVSALSTRLPQTLLPASPPSPVPPNCWDATTANQLGGGSPVTISLPLSFISIIFDLARLVAERAASSPQRALINCHANTTEGQACLRKGWPTVLWAGIAPARKGTWQIPLITQKLSRWMKPRVQPTLCLGLEFCWVCFFFFNIHLRQCQAHPLILKLAVHSYFQKNASVEAEYLFCGHLCW